MNILVAPPTVCSVKLSETLFTASTSRRVHVRLYSRRVQLVRLSMGLEACQSAVFRACHSYHSAAGRLVAKRPAASLVASLVVTLLLTGCMLLGSWEARLEYRNTLSRSAAFKLFDATLDMFGGSPRTNEYKMSSSDGSNVLTKQAILKALEVDEAVLGLTYKAPVSRMYAFAHTSAARAQSTRPCTVSVWAAKRSKRSAKKSWTASCWRSTTRTRAGSAPSSAG